MLHAVMKLFVCLVLWVLFETYQSNRITNFIKFLETDDRPLFDGNVPESNAFTREEIILMGDYQPIVTSRTQETCSLTHSGEIQQYDDIDYIEPTNAAILESTNPQTLQKRIFLLPRAVRKYDSTVSFGDYIEMKIDKYTSDVLLFEEKRNTHGDPYVEYRRRLITSDANLNFYFEDPRVFTFYDNTVSRIRYLLAGTHYKPKEGFIMDKFIELEINTLGEPLPPIINQTTGIPNFRFLSPVDVKWCDAKDAVISMNEENDIIVRTRYKFDFEDEHVKKWSHGMKWKYGEQLFKFENFGDLLNYNWGFAVEDLFSEDHKIPQNRVAPKQTKILLIDDWVIEHFKNPLVIEGIKGFGPGAPMVRFIRKNKQIFISDMKESEQMFVGNLSDSVIPNFLIMDHEVKYLSFDHELRNLNHFQHRHYTLTMKIFDSTQTNLEWYFSDAIQPRTMLERGINSGIVDLQHVFPMGRVLVNGQNGVKIRVYAGVADAHVGIYEFDAMKLILEVFVSNSHQHLSGQIYQPNKAI